jgi:peptidyl-tRNA hydrolase
MVPAFADRLREMGPVQAEGGADDPLAMYYVVRKDVPLALGEAMALAGAAAVRCRDQLAGDARFARAFEAWGERPRKVALRASAEQLDELRDACAGAYLEPGLVCLPPMRKSDRPPLLAKLRPFTDAPRPKEPPDPPPRERALVYAVRPGVIRTTGKAMAQAGHAALMAADEYDRDALAAWRAAGMPGLVVLVEHDDGWERLKRSPGALVVRDAGLTQVEAGTETVIALPPGAAAADGLSPVP